MTARSDTTARGAAHIWVPFRETALYVAFTDDAGFTDGPSLLDDAVPRGGVTLDDRYGAPMWRIDAQRLHAVVEALWNDDHQVRIHLDQAPTVGRTTAGRGRSAPQTVPRG